MGAHGLAHQVGERKEKIVIKRGIDKTNQELGYRYTTKS